MKFGVCCFIKNENLYLREWVEHYIKLDFDKIILYDNNDIDGEIPNVVIQDYIDRGIVDVHDYRGINSHVYPDSYVESQINAYNDCLEKYKDKLDWIAFFDTDEFLYIEDNRNIHAIFAENPYNAFDEIILCWYLMGGKSLYYDNRPVAERFVNHITYHTTPDDYECDCFIKPFIRLASGIKFSGINMHSVFSDNVCNGKGIKCSIYENTQQLNFVCHSSMYLKHYQFKSFTEFLYRKNKLLNHRNIEIYKEAHGWSDEHERILQDFIKKYDIKL